MQKQPFMSHGSIKFTLDNDLVTMDIEGPCNTEFFELMSKKLSTLIPQINMDNYTGLVILRGEALATPEAMLYFTDYLKTIHARAVAINLQYAQTPSLTEKICKKSYTDAGVKHRFFLDNLSAIAWLRDCMAIPR
jgi:hypothetical protein